MKKWNIKKYLIITLIAVLIAAFIFVMFNQGIIWFNNPSQSEYPVRGVDISAHQGEIDWYSIAS